MCSVCSSRVVGRVLVSVGVMFMAASTALGHTGLDEPNGAEVLAVDSTFTVEWRILIEHDLQNWDLWYSTTGDAGPWIPMAMDLLAGDPSMGSVHTYQWTVPDNPSDQVRVRVRMDNSGQDYEDVSDGDLTIQEVGIPTVSEWGMVVMTLLVLATGTVLISRKVIPRRLPEPRA